MRLAPGLVPTTEDNPAPVDTMKMPKLLPVTAQSVMRISAFPVLVFSASSPALLPSARQLARVRSTLTLSDLATNPSPLRDAGQLVTHPAAVAVPAKAPTRTPASVHSVNRESCATRLSGVASLGPT